MAKKDPLPEHYQWLQERFPDVLEAYEDLGAAVHTAGPLDGHTRALVKLATAVGAGREGAVHAHVRKALDAGATPEEILHAVVLATPTIGFPGTAAALSWVRDILEAKKGGRRRR